MVRSPGYRAKPRVFRGFDMRNQHRGWYDARIRRYNYNWNKDWVKPRGVQGISYQTAFANAPRNPYDYYVLDSKAHVRRREVDMNQLEQDRFNHMVGNQIIRQLEDRGLPSDVIANIAEYVGGVA